MDLYIYVIECESIEGVYYKIGVTNNLNQRLKNIRTGNPNKVSYIFYEKNNNAYKVEKWLHSQFSENREEGEWFKNITLEDIRIKLFEYNDFDL